MKDEPIKAEDNGSNIKKKQENVIQKTNPVIAINYNQQKKICKEMDETVFGQPP